MAAVIGAARKSPAAAELSILRFTLEGLLECYRPLAASVARRFLAAPICVRAAPRQPDEAHGCVEPAPAPMNAWHLTSWDEETWALLRTGVAHAFSDNQKGDPQRPSFHELSRVVRDVVQVRRWEKDLYIRCPTSSRPGPIFV